MRPTNEKYYTTSAIEPNEKQYTIKEIRRLTKLARKIAGDPPTLMFSDPAEERLT